MPRTRTSILCAVLALLAVAPPARAVPRDGADDGPPRSLSTLRRVLRRFDFEEAERLRTDFPLGFVRVIAEDRGFPPFGSATLTTDAAWTGRWSLRFGLDGGSLAVATPTGILPILAGADYAVSVRARTAGLDHARAQLVATLHDAEGRPIPASRAESPLVRTDGAWRALEVLVAGTHPDAVDLVVELQVLQPRQYEPAPAPDQPMLEDLVGAAFFDDLVIRHAPHIELSIDAPLNVIEGPRRARLDLTVRDLTNEPLRARVRVTDADGRSAFDRTVPAPRGRDPLSFTLAAERCGWYRAEVELLDAEARVANRTLDFVVLPAPAPGAPRRCDRLAAALPPVDPDHADELPRLVRALHAGGAIVPIWDGVDDPRGADERHVAQRRTVEALLADDVELTFALERLPAGLAQALGLDREQVLETFGSAPGTWRPELDRTLLSFGLRVRRWQVGRADAPDAFWKDDLAGLVGRAAAALSEFVPDPAIVVPYTAEQDAAEDRATTAVRLRVPAAIRPAEIPDCLARWRGGASLLAAEFETLPADRFDPGERVTDLALRLLHGWRAEIEQMILAAPWRRARGASGRPEPGPAFAAFRGLADALAGRRFAGELPVGPGVRAWLMAGDPGRTHALVLWRDERLGATAAAERVVLGAGDVVLRDVFGNTRRLAPVDGAHVVPVGDRPTFVEGIDLDLARFRAGFRLDPPLVQALNRVHEHEVVLTNPFAETISGTLMLDEPAGTRFNPRQHSFVVRAGETVRLPIEISLDRAIVAGPRRLAADVVLASMGGRRVRLHTNAEIDWPEVAVEATWRIQRNPVSGLRDLVITHVVTNTGPSVLNVDAFLVAPGIGRSRQVIAALAPGTTTRKTFLVPDGASRLAGASVQYGVAERDGIAQVNRILEIPASLRDAKVKTSKSQKVKIGR